MTPDFSVLKDFNIEQVIPVSGGDICDAYKIVCKTNSFFVKTHQPSMYGMLKCEANNLQSIAATNTVLTPKPISHGQTDDYSFLVLEYLELIPSGSHAELGTKLASMHQNHGDYFGWEENNWIGASTQPNNKHKDWIAFWRDMRLGHQLELAEKKCAPRSMLSNCEKLQCDFDALFESYSPAPSLLHGDLWSGNFAFTADGNPVIYDPACYYGDCEADLAMTELFGGFSQDFYSAYNEHFPIDEGYRVRKNFYNLYHILNHFNLFGGSYAAQAERLCTKLLSEIQ